MRALRPLTTAALTALAVSLVPNAASLQMRSVAAHLDTGRPASRQVVNLVSCESRWLEVQAWAASPLLTGPNSPPTMMQEIVRVDSSGHTCRLPSGWLRLTPIHDKGTPYASIRQTDVGRSLNITLSAHEFAVANVTIAVPWFIPYDNDCESEALIGVTPPASGRVSGGFGVPALCGERSGSILKATVGAFQAIDSEVPNARGTLVAHLQPGPMALGQNGVLYISEPSLEQVVARLPDGSFKRIAGTGRAGYSGDGGPAIRAMLRQPEGLAVAADGTVYIADFGNNRVREVLPDGTIETVAGAGGKAPETIPINGLPGGPALRVHIWSPSAIAIGRGGALYIAVDNENAIVELHKGVITTVVTGSDLKSVPFFAEDQLCGPDGLALDARGDLYFDCAQAALTLMRTPAGRLVSRGEWEASGFSSFSARGGETVDAVTTAGIVSLTPTAEEITHVSSVIPHVGVIYLEGIAAGLGGTVYLDQSGGYGPPAILALRDGRVTTVWAADA